MTTESMFAVETKNPDDTWSQYAVMKEADARHAVQIGRGHVRAVLLVDVEHSTRIDDAPKALVVSCEGCDWSRTYHYSAQMGSDDAAFILALAACNEHRDANAPVSSPSTTRVASRSTSTDLDPTTAALIRKLMFSGVVEYRASARYHGHDPQAVVNGYDSQTLTNDEEDLLRRYLDIEPARDT